jgi:pullulanase
MDNSNKLRYIETVRSYCAHITLFHNLSYKHGESCMKKISLLLVLILVALVVPTNAQDVPDLVNVPGTIQAELGCPGPWAPDCEETALDYYPEWDVWFRTFELPQGSYEYKVAINGSWDENYGGFADANGPNIALNTSEDTTITFYYDHKTNWIADDVRHTIVTAVGSFQDEIGCAEDNSAECMLSWMQDVGGSGIYTWTAENIPTGDYTARFAFNRDGSETYGEDGTPESADLTFSVPEDNMPVAFTYDSTLNLMVINVGGASLSAANLRERRAHWVLGNTILWDDINPDNYYQLLYSPDASMELTLFGLQGDYQSINLDIAESIPADVLDKFPHLEGKTALTIRESDMPLVSDILKGQFAVANYDPSDNLVNISGLQIAGALDDLYTYDGDLGVTWDVNGIPSITLWAPTARNVTLQLFADSNARTEPTLYPMSYNAEQGTWRIVGQPAWRGQFYLFDVEVFVPTEMAVLNNQVTDPYSVSLATNSLRSQIVDLNDPMLQPEGWDALMKPDNFGAPEDITIYELHVRDFSAYDDTVPEEMRGTYMAFTVPDASGVQHLQGLVDAGLTHLHLLPTFDIATINENRNRWFEPDPTELASFAPDSEEQQAEIDPLRDLDGFNWGYDPYHWNVPEGSYSTNADGTTRIVEYRQMVQALNQMGLNVVQDVVYNHTNGVGQSSRSVLDKIVPGYYYRLDDKGTVYTSTCCPNTATEHNMMRRLMIDSIVFHATQYKVDGFRFDLMGHHMLEDMRQVRQALDALTLEEHGVDGKRIYVYGEGWNFGEVQDNARGINATQLNIAGTGIGVFNDRLRDAVRGGSPFGGQLEQGLATLQYTAPNGLADINANLAEVLLHADHVRVGLAGNLADFTFTDRNGDEVNTTQVMYGDAPSGYTGDPQENIIYVSKHDNETLYDEIAYKAPRDTTMADRIRMQNLGLAYVMYSQGVPFFHAGSDMLRSKSMDRNSYNSGDWFNRLDFTYQTNNFGVGLPPAGDNSAQWDLMRPLLADESLQASEADILANVNSFRDMLRVRYSTPLFRLQTADEIMQRLTFHNTGAEQVPGVIVMHIADTVGDDLDPAHDAVVVVFNATPDELTFTVDALAGQAFALHPALADGSDAVLASASYDSESGTFTVPAISAAVYVLPQS